MASGSLQSQTSSVVSRGGSGGSTSGGAPRRESYAAARLRRRRKSSGNRNGGGLFGSNNMLRFYTDGAPWVKITTKVVLVTSLCFIGFVTAFHVIGKLYHLKSAGA